MIAFIFYTLGLFVALVTFFAFVQGYIILFKRNLKLAIMAILVSGLFWFIPDYVLAGLLFFALNCLVAAYAKILDKKLQA